MAKIYGGKWQNLERIGGGGQAEVYRVTDESNGGKEYALKRFVNTDRLARFEREIKVVGSLNRPDIINIYDYSLDPEAPYYVMDLMNGGSLDRRSQRYRGNLGASLDLLIGVCEPVAALHDAGIVHRDLKPGNILFRSDSDDLPIIADFGLCWVDEGTKLTESEEIVGPRYFIAPEIESGAERDPKPAADVYSLGKLLYYVVSGGRILPREDHREERFDLQRTLAAVDDTSVYRAQLEYISRLLDHTVVKDPNVRWYNAGVFLQMLWIVRRLVGEGRYPLAARMPCRFCGLETYRWLNSQPGPYQILHGPDMPPKSGGLPIAILYCPKCGHMEMFRRNILGKDDSIVGLPADQVPPVQ